jgi:hypothetical protein
VVLEELLPESEELYKEVQRYKEEKGSKKAEKLRRKKGGRKFFGRWNFSDRRREEPLVGATSGRLRSPPGNLKEDLPSIREKGLRQQPETSILHELAHYLSW